MSSHKLLLIISLVSLIPQRPVYGQSGTAGRAVPDPTIPAKATTDNSLAVNPLTGLTSASSSNYKPLTGKQRRQLYWKQNYFSAGAYVGPVLSALILDQATGTPHEWGGGMEGFGKRLGSRLLSSTIQGNIQAGLAVPLHEDVRYISSGRGSTGHRIVHAIVFSFVTYNNHGHVTPNIANLTGYYASTAISTTWVPTDDPLGRYTLIHGSEQIALAIPVNILQEFWPDLSRKFLHHP
jgi:hypothetical protein